MFFTHSHWDHIQGFPFFVPAFVPGNQFDIYGTITPDGSTIEQRLNSQMLHPNFPVPLQIMGSKLNFFDIDKEEAVTLDSGVRVDNALLNHPGESCRLSGKVGMVMQRPTSRILNIYTDRLDEKRCSTLTRRRYPDLRCNLFRRGVLQRKE